MRFALSQLLDLERGFWRAAGDARAYGASLAADAWHVFPGIGIIGRDEILTAVAESSPWAEFAIFDPRMVVLGDGAAVLLYTAEARRADSPWYRAGVSSVYRRAGAEIELVLHQQTPLEAPER